jgi:hypothetical protein
MRKGLLILGIGLLACASLRAQTLSTSFVDVVVLDVPLGTSRTVEDRDGKGIVLRNKGDVALHVRLRAKIPLENELKEKAEAIPDISWIRFDPDTVKIAANGEIDCRLVIKVPKKREFRNRLFQATILMEAEPPNTGHVQVRGALKARLRFQTIR